MRHTNILKSIFSPYKLPQEPLPAAAMATGSRQLPRAALSFQKVPSSLHEITFQIPTVIFSHLILTQRFEIKSRHHITPESSDGGFTSQNVIVKLELEENSDTFVWI